MTNHPRTDAVGPDAPQCDGRVWCAGVVRGCGARVRCAGAVGKQVQASEREASKRLAMSQRTAGANRDGEKLSKRASNCESESESEAASEKF